MLLCDKSVVIIYLFILLFIYLLIDDERFVKLTRRYLQCNDMKNVRRITLYIKEVVQSFLAGARFEHENQ